MLKSLCLIVWYVVCVLVSSESIHLRVAHVTTLSVGHSTSESLRHQGIVNIC